MQGTWKENLNGFDRKGNKRKKQTRNNSIKDKGRALLKVYNGYSRCNNKTVKPYDDSFRIEGEFESVPNKSTFTYSGWVETWRVEVVRYIGKRYTEDGMYLWDAHSYSVRTAYYYFGNWYDEYDDSLIDGDVRKLAFLYKEEVKYDTPVETRGSNCRWCVNYTESTYIYNTLVPDWKRMTFYGDGKRRKYAQKMANKRDRALLREWISREDFDAEMKTHALSKSILWEIW